MMGVFETSTPLLEALRGIASREESITAVRILVFLFALCAALAWARARPRLALSLLGLGGILGLGYWLVQLVSPIGFGSDASMTRTWAQVGVSGALSQTGAGFVWGTPAEASLLVTLAAAGVPVSMLFAAPRIAVLLGLLLLALLPRWSIRNRTSALFAGCLVLGGGLWPGFSPYEYLLRHPVAVGGLALGAFLIAAAARHRMLEGRLRRVRFALVGALIAAAALARSADAGERATLVSSLLLIWGTMMLASPTRVLIRNLSSSPARARRLEGLAVLVAFSGSGLFWWDPPHTVPGFLQAKDPGTALGRPLEWIRRNVAAEAVVLASPAYSGPLAAFTGRRVLFPPPSEDSHGALLPEPARRERLYTSTLAGEPVARLAEHFAVTHLLLGPGETAEPVPVQPRIDDEPRLRLVLVYQDIEDFRVFRLTKK